MTLELGGMVVTGGEVGLSFVVVGNGWRRRQGSKGTRSLLKSESVIGIERAATARGRRGLLLGSSVVVLLTRSSSLMAATAASNVSKTALLQEYLKKSEMNKSKNDKERLDDYYKRNYKDYFEFFQGSARGKTNEQLSEAEKGILSWLETNK